MSSYVVGNVIRVTATFSDPVTNLPLDPTVVKLTFGTKTAPTTWTYLATGAIIRDSLGTFHADLDTTGGIALGKPTVWLYEWTSTGTGQAANSGQFTIMPLPLLVG